MTYSIRKQFHTSLASTVLQDIMFQRDIYYYFLGKTDTWGQTDEPSSGQPALTEDADMLIRNNIAFLKRINASDVSLMCARHNWTSGTVYAQWDNTIDMEGTNFYIINSSGGVYKCLFNNHGAASTVLPTYNSYSPFTTADGYIWKYMYTVPSFKTSKFTNTNLIPVQTALTDSFYNTGAVDSITITNQGSGYTDQLVTYISVAGSSGAGAVLVPKIDHSTGSIVDVIVVNGGADYNPAYPPSLEVHVLPGHAAGTNLYWENQNIGTAILVPVVSNGQIKSVMIADPGQHYPFSTATSITVTGDGTGLTVYPVVYDGKIIDTIIENHGSGYTYVHLTVTGNGTNAAMSATFANSDFTSDQNIVEQSAVDGAIYAINVTGSGSGYTETTTVTIQGDGTGATATATVVDGSISKINVTSHGTGYTYVRVVIADVNRIGNGFTDATAYAILPPNGGHGSNAVQELYGKTLAIVSPIKVDPLNTNFNQDYRQYGLLKKPKNVFTNAPSTIGMDSSSYQVTFNTVNNLNIDQTVYLNDVYPYLVIYKQGNTVWLQPLHKANIDPVGNIKNGNYTYVSSNLAARPTINKYSGDLVYTSDELPFIFSESQGLTVKTYITF